MEIRPIDGIQLKKPTPVRKGVSVRVTVVSRTVEPVLSTGIQTRSRSIVVYGVVALMLASFASGLWAMWQTRITFAEDKKPSESVVVQPAAPTSIPLVQGEAVLGATTRGSTSADLLHMTLEELERRPPQPTIEANTNSVDPVLEARKEKLRTYLAAKKSPLVSIVDTLASLQHWRTVLAISNSESSLGKRCADNNCSGIGVEPGHPLWRTYKTKADWAKDLDALIEKRYKNWTLEQMNGVYNKPGSENWVFAAQQILDDIKDIE